MQAPAALPMPQDSPAHRPPRRGLRAACLILSIGGLIVCGVLVYIASFGGEGGLAQLLCRPGARVNCDVVLASRWARVGPFSTAEWGAAYFLVLVIWFAAVGPANRAGRAWHLAALIFQALGVSASAALAWTMGRSLGVWCTWCGAGHVINGLLLVLGIAAYPWRTDSAPGPAHPSTARAWIAVLGGLAACLILGLTSLAYRQQQAAIRFRQLYVDAVNTADYAEWRWRSAPHQEIPLRPDDASIGSADAPLTAVVFTDFQCPRCAQFHAMAERLVEEFPGRVRFVLRHFPICRDCNPHVERTLHRDACAAARALEAARAVAPDRRAAFGGALFRSQRDLGARPFEQLAKGVGIDPARLTEAIQQEAGAERIREDVALGKTLGLEGTPSVFLDGRRLERWWLLRSDGKAVDWDATVVLWEQLLGVEAVDHKGDRLAGES